MNSVFFPQAALDVLVALGRADVIGDELVLTEEGYRYRVEEGTRVVREVTTGDDPRDLCGRVFLNEKLIVEHAAEILGNSMIIEDSAYDIVPGFLGLPSGDVDPSATAGRREQDALSALQSLEELQEALA
jgi:hypothetical protein